MTKKRIILSTSLLCASAVVLFSLRNLSPASTPVPVVVKNIKKPATHTPPKIVVENPQVQNLLAEYEEALQLLMKKAHAPGAAVAIVKDSSIIYLKGFGLKTIGTQDSVDIETVFRLGSVSKCFAPALTGILVQDNLLSWNDKVLQYLPDFSLQSKEQTELLTLRHILSHTMGLPYHTYTNLIEEGDSLHFMLSKLRDINMIGPVGKVYSYQNVGYSLISEVIQSASGKSYEDLMTERIFTPLNMDKASISYNKIKSNNNVAMPHSHTRKGLQPTKISDTYYNVAPAGGINASISDMAQWIIAMLGNRNDIISNKTLDEIFTPVIKAPSKNRNFRKWIRQTGSQYAMGWRVLSFKTDTLFYHGGYVNGYRSELAINRKDKIGICVLTNATGELADNSIPYFFNLYLKKRDSINSWEKQNSLQAKQSVKP